MDYRDVGIYIRVSTEEQAKSGMSLAAQTEKLKAYCSVNEWPFIIYEDAGISGSTITDRPALSKLLDDCKNNKIKIVLVYKLDRLSRSLRDIILTIDELREYKVDFVSVTEQIDTTTAVGQLMFHMIGAFAEFERNITKERIALGMNKKASDGYNQSRAPFGYYFEDGIMIKHPEDSEIVKNIFEDYIKERSIGTVAKKYNIHRSLVHRILNNIIYLGQIKWKGAALQGSHDPIIDLPMFEAVKDILKCNQINVKKQ